MLRVRLKNGGRPESAAQERVLEDSRISGCSEALPPVIVKASRAIVKYFCFVTDAVPNVLWDSAAVAQVSLRKNMRHSVTSQAECGWERWTALPESAAPPAVQSLRALGQRVIHPARRASCSARIAQAHAPRRAIVSLKMAGVRIPRQAVTSHKKDCLVRNGPVRFIPEAPN